MTLPDGFTEHDGGECPVDPEMRVVCVVRTGGGLRYSHAGPAHKHEWCASKLPDGLGAVVGYRPAHPRESLTADMLHQELRANDA